MKARDATGRFEALPGKGSKNKITLMVSDEFLEAVKREANGNVGRYIREVVEKKLSETWQSQSLDTSAR